MNMEDFTQWMEIDTDAYFIGLEIMEEINAQKDGE